MNRFKFNLEHRDLSRQNFSSRRNPLLELRGFTLRDCPRTFRPSLGFSASVSVIRRCESRRLRPTIRKVLAAMRESDPTQWPQSAKSYASRPGKREPVRRDPDVMIHEFAHIGGDEFAVGAEWARRQFAPTSGSKIGNSRPLPISTGKDCDRGMVKLGCPRKTGLLPAVASPVIPASEALPRSGNCLRQRCRSGAAASVPEFNVPRNGAFADGFPCHRPHQRTSPVAGGQHTRKGSSRDPAAKADATHSGRRPESAVDNSGSLGFSDKRVGGKSQGSSGPRKRVGGSPPSLSQAFWTDGGFGT